MDFGDGALNCEMSALSPELRNCHRNRGCSCHVTGAQVFLFKYWGMGRSQALVGPG